MPTSANETRDEATVSAGPARLRDAVVQLRDLLAWGRGQLERAGVTPVEAEWLLKWVLNQDSLLLAPQDVGIRAAETYRSAIAQRRAHVPLQHIMGEMPFRGLTLRAGPGVFATRRVTEMLVEYALEVAPQEGGRIADLCSGSGAIGLALASELPQSAVWLVENSSRAMAYLRKNVAGIDTGTSVVTAVFDNALEALTELDGTLDLVVSNPPYVGLSDAPTQPEALADPATALYGGGEDGLVIPRGVVGRAFQLLAPGGSLVMEHGERQAEALVTHALSVGFAGAETRDDLAGRHRFLIARKPVSGPTEREVEGRRVSG